MSAAVRGLTRSVSIRGLRPHHVDSVEFVGLGRLAGVAFAAGGYSAEFHAGDGTYWLKGQGDEVLEYWITEDELRRRRLTNEQRRRA